MYNDIDIDKKRKHLLFILGSLTFILANIIFVFYNYTKQSTLEIIISIFLISITLFALISLKKFNSDLFIYRIYLFFVSVAWIYSVPHGTGQGTALYWSYSLPLLFFFFFGKKEGLIWSVIFSFFLFFVIFLPAVFGWYSYGRIIILRYIITFGIVTMIGYGLESARDFSSRMLEEKNKALLEEKEQLEVALKEIKTLSGLIPICSSCKKIRNDEGYWEQVETYIKNHSGADFTHGICPECIAKLYPDYTGKTEK
jgi:hypothetical protein